MRTIIAGLIPHNRTAVQSAIIYSSITTAAATFTPPGSILPTAMRIVPISGGDILIETNGTACDIASTTLSGASLEHFVGLSSGTGVRIAGKTGTVTFQLSWVSEV